jgi:hypothetical protein
MISIKPTLAVPTPSGFVGTSSWFYYSIKQNSEQATPQTLRNFKILQLRMP